MAIRYKIDVIEALKNKGLTTYDIQKQNIFGNSTMQRFRRGEVVTAPILSDLCRVLECDIADLLEYVPDDKPEE